MHQRRAKPVDTPGVLVLMETDGRPETTGFLHQGATDQEKGWAEIWGTESSASSGWSYDGGNANGPLSPSCDAKGWDMAKQSLSALWAEEWSERNWVIDSFWPHKTALSWGNRRHLCARRQGKNARKMQLLRKFLFLAGAWKKGMVWCHMSTFQSIPGAFKGNSKEFFFFFNHFNKLLNNV